jgi:dCMP deaminase
MPSPNTSNSSVNQFISKWDLRFLRIAREVQSWSKDPSTKCGCVLVHDRRILSSGYNGLPSSLSESLERYMDRDFKLASIIHAEKNAIFNAAKNGSQTEGATAYITWPPCSQCASALIQAGVSKVVCPNPNSGPKRWVTNFLLANELLYEAGVKVLYYSDSDLCQTETSIHTHTRGKTELPTT